MLEIHRTLPASPAAVFAAWTDPAKVSRWFGPGTFTCPRAEIDLRPGGRYRIEIRDPAGPGPSLVATGVYREIKPFERLVFTWTWEDGTLPETLVTVQLRGVGDKTELYLVHERFPTQKDVEEHNVGWMGCLPKLPAACNAE